MLGWLFTGERCLHNDRSFSRIAYDFMALDGVRSLGSQDVPYEEIYNRYSFLLLFGGKTGSYNICTSGLVVLI